MKWIRRSRQLGQAVKNAQRLRQITAVFARHGFVDVVEKMHLQKFLPKSLAAFAESQAEFSTPERLRKAFEDLGPTFVKLGQLLSTRPDLIPPPYIEEFTKLQDNVLPLDFDRIRAVIETELGQKYDSAFSTLNPAPLASGSIAQVHEARLKTGEQVVIKVQRPEIRKTIETDISLLAFLAGLLEKYVPETRVASPRVIVDEFFRTLMFELDFRVEANNMVKIAESVASIPEIVIPKVYKNLSTSRILTLEKLEGIRVNDLKALDAAGIDRKKIVDLGARAFFKTVLIDGLFHGDLHGGNLFILPGNRLGIIDFGIVGRLSERSRDQLANMVMSLITEDYENLCYQYAELGAAGPSIDFEGFQREVMNTLSPYLGLPIEEFNVGKVLIEATKIATKYQIKVPGDWMIVFKAILTLEGMGRTLDPSFDLLALGQQLVKDLIKNQYSVDRIGRDLMWVARDAAQLLAILPRQIRWMFQKFNRNDFAFEIKSDDLEEIGRQIELSGRRLSLSILVAGLFVASSLALHTPEGHQLFHYPLFSVLYFGMGAVVLFRIFVASFK